MEKCSQCDKVAIQKYGDNYLCLDCLERLSNIHHRENEQRHREMIYRMQMANVADKDLNETLGFYGQKPPFDLSVFKPSRNIKLSNVNVSNSVVGNISTEEVGNINVSLEKIHSGGNIDTAQKIHDLTKAILESDEITVDLKNEVLEQISMLAEQVSLPPQNRKKGIIKAALSAIKETASTTASVVAVWEKIEPFLKQLF